MTNHELFVEPILSIVPSELAIDTRLTAVQLRVLIAAFSFRAPNTNTYWPTAEEVASRCELPTQVVDDMAPDLLALGWIVEQNDEFRLYVPDHLEVRA
jgi:hypothetical protein